MPTDNYKNTNIIYKKNTYNEKKYTKMSKMRWNWNVYETLINISNLVTIPVESKSICLKSAVEKNDGNLQISFVTGLNSEIPQEKI